MKKKPESLKIGLLRSPEELDELDKERKERDRKAAQFVRDGVAEAKRRGVPLHEIIPVH